MTKVRVNANYQGTERKEVDGVVIRKSGKTAHVHIRDEVAERLLDFDNREGNRPSSGSSQLDAFFPLYRVIKRKVARDFPADTD